MSIAERCLGLVVIGIITVIILYLFTIDEV